MSTILIYLIILAKKVFEDNNNNRNKPLNEIDLTW
jgi:hypothetical protein